MTDSNALAPADPSRAEFEAWYDRQCKRSDDAKQGLISAWTWLAWQAARRTPAPASQPVAVPAGIDPVASKSHGAWDGIEDVLDMPDGTEIFTAAQVQAMLAAAPSGPAREPLTDEQIEDLIGFGDPTEQEKFLVRLGWSAANGITAAKKGGHHAE